MVVELVFVRMGLFTQFCFGGWAVCAVIFVFTQLRFVG